VPDGVTQGWSLTRSVDEMPAAESQTEAARRHLVGICVRKATHRVGFVLGIGHPGSCGEADAPYDNGEQAYPD